MAVVPSTRTFSEVEHLPCYVDILPLISERYHSLCVQNDGQKDPVPADMRAFCSSQPPAMSVNDFIVRLCKYGHCSPETFVVMIIFLERCLERSSCPVNSKTFLRLILGSFVVAAKLRDDVYYTNAYYASIGGLTTGHVNAMEIALLRSIDWDVGVAQEEFEKVRERMQMKEKVWVLPRSGLRRRATPPMAAVDAARRSRVAESVDSPPEKVAAPPSAPAPKVGSGSRPAPRGAAARTQQQQRSPSPAKGSAKRPASSSAGTRATSPVPVISATKQRSTRGAGTARGGRPGARQEVHPQTEDMGPWSG
eukprot:TRINITY_DN569_c1_g3_i1.p1 TRINITY_DN569_c1_g3~~TRINITY_DN569_c1_g3_i1.p1  ORF type:complete len:308 (+),score=102.91 TRINITY_DN569_c1_g3_i1:212-1135(+)